MKKVIIALLVSITLIAAIGYTSIYSTAAIVKLNKNIQFEQKSEPQKIYEFPDYYRGIYLTMPSGRDMEKLQLFVEKAKSADINVLVIDCESPRSKENVIPAENIKYCIENGIHPIARIVLFPDGLSYYPVQQSVIDEKLAVAESACISGFREIQFDYIRFNDSNKIKNLTLNDRYTFIDGILTKARQRLEKYNPRIAVDIFGRVPLNQNDIVGQKMEFLDKSADIICPMAYPSHYTWSKKMQDDPYYTVYETSKKAAERSKNAQIVTYIQTFRIRLGSNSYDHYIREQIKAVHDSGVKGYIMWNARQDYETPLRVAKEYYLKNPKITTAISKKTETSERKPI